MGDNLTWRENRCIKTGRLHHSFLHATSDTQEIAMNGKAWKGRQSLKHAFWPAEELLAMTASSTQATWLGQWLHPPSNAMQCPTVIPGSGRSPGEGNGNPPQYSCLENPMDRGAWRLQSMGSQRVGHDWSEYTSLHIYSCQATLIDPVSSDCHIFLLRGTDRIYFSGA